MSKCVIPISGGIDSTVILHHVKKQREDIDEIYTLTFNYGQRHDKEINCAIDQSFGNVKSHKVIDTTFLGNLFTSSSLTNDEIDIAKTKDVLGDPQTVNYVPNRNAIILSICAGYAESVGASTVFHGAALVDSEAGYWDGSNEFLQSINNLLSLNRRDRVQIEAPLINMTKQEIIALGVETGVNFSNTWTCYEGEDMACGKCPACSSRIKGFIDNKLIDPIVYSIDIPWEDFNCVSI